MNSDGKIYYVNHKKNDGYNVKMSMEDERQYRSTLCMTTDSKPSRTAA
jgi:hypothetical protein